MIRPTKATPGGRAYLDLQNRARREKRPTQELMTLYVVERWLARLAESPHSDTFVLKGGVLLAVFDARRPTADADLLARHLSNDEQVVRTHVGEVSQISPRVDDGVEFLPETITTGAIRDGDLYSGVRISMDCRISGAAVKLKLDINFGDPVTPEPQLIELPSQRPTMPAVQVLGYPIETVLAEKTSTAIALGQANTRVRDYADLFTLTGRHSFGYTALRAALHATTTHRGVSLSPLSDALGSLHATRQGAYSAFRRRLGDDGAHLPADFADVITAVVAFVDPLATGEAAGMTWNPRSRRWS